MEVLGDETFGFGDVGVGLVVPGTYTLCWCSGRLPGTSCAAAADFRAARCLDVAVLRAAWARYESADMQAERF